MPMPFLKRHWLKLLIAALVLIAITVVAFIVIRNQRADQEQKIYNQMIYIEGKWSNIKTDPDEELPYRLRLEFFYDPKSNSVVGIHCFSNLSDKNLSAVYISGCARGSFSASTLSLYLNKVDLANDTMTFDFYAVEGASQLVLTKKDNESYVEVSGESPLKALGKIAMGRVINGE